MNMYRLVVDMKTIQIVHTLKTAERVQEYINYARLQGYGIELTCPTQHDAHVELWENWSFDQDIANEIAFDARATWL